MTIMRKIIIGERIAKLNAEADRLDGHTNYSTRMAAAKRNLALELACELKRDERPAVEHPEDLGQYRNFQRENFDQGGDE